jgi:hypothetical protein
MVDAEYVLTAATVLAEAVGQLRDRELDVAVAHERVVTELRRIERRDRVV